MVLRCISSSVSMYKGQKGLKTVFWKKFRKRKANTAVVVNKKRWTENDDDAGEDVIENEKDAKITTPTVIAVSLKDFFWIVAFVGGRVSWNFHGIKFKLS